MEDDATRRRWLKVSVCRVCLIGRPLCNLRHPKLTQRRQKTLEPFEDVPKDQVERFIEQVLEQSRLL